jgi:hypothetical protein
LQKYKADVQDIAHATLKALNRNSTAAQESPMIEIPLSPEEFQSKAAQIAKQGIVLTGNEGTIEKMGVKAHWSYTDGVLKIAILDKPFFLTEQSVEDQLRKWL